MINKMIEKTELPDILKLDEEEEEEYMYIFCSA